jgi:cystathionine beta-lyase
VLFDRAADIVDTWRHGEVRYSYGLYGTPTALELAARIAELENAQHTFLTPSGQSAIALVYLAFARPGAHILVPANAYGPTQEFATALLTQLGVEVERYNPRIGKGISELLRPSTRLIWCESPGSGTFEIQDIPAIARAAHDRQITVALDNTYSAGVYFDAFGHGADISVQALSKYVAGHSDVLLGSVSVSSTDLYESIGQMFWLLGMGVSPDECSLALRGLQTLAIRLDYLRQAGLRVAEFLTTVPVIEEVLHPELPTFPDHALWKRDFTGSTSVFSFRFRPGVPKEAATLLLDGLKLFKMGLSWGGVTSLATMFPDPKRAGIETAPQLVRLSIGVEAVEDLVEDLKTALRNVRL